MHRYTLVN